MPVDAMTLLIAGLSSSRLRPAFIVLVAVFTPASLTCLSNISRTAGSRRRSATRLSLAAMNCRKFSSVSLYSVACSTLFMSVGVICAVPPASIATMSIVDGRRRLRPNHAIAAAHATPASQGRSRSRGARGEALEDGVGRRGHRLLRLGPAGDARARPDPAA